MTQPILVCMSWRGGARFERCLRSIARSKHHFKRIVLSITSDENSEDMRNAHAFQKQHPEVEVLCTGRELPTMQHQAFWVTYLEQTGAKPTDWIYWLAYDDEVRKTGIDNLVDDGGNWPLESGTVYFGPWAMRHEEPDRLWDGDTTAQLESWTSFPVDGPDRLHVMTWIKGQLRQPTYIQMSGSVAPFDNFLQLRDGRPRKLGPMRIEMVTAARQGTNHIQEFREPISIIYSRSNSDRASYGRSSRTEDLHLILWLTRGCLMSPARLKRVIGLILSESWRLFTLRIAAQSAPVEEWRVRQSGVCP